MSVPNLWHLHDHAEIDALLTVLEHVDEIAAEEVPRDALIREFIGDGEFRH